MRQARLARRLIGRADLVPDHMRDDGRTVIRDDHQLQSVGEREVGDFGATLPAASEETASAAASAMSVKFILASTLLDLNMLRSCRSTKSG